MSDAGIAPMNIVGGAMVAQVSMLVIIFVCSLMIRLSEFHINPAWQSSFPRCVGWTGALTLVSLGLLLTSDAFSGVWAPLLQQPVGSFISWSTALLWMFILDILVVSMLVFTTGGGQSPFQPIFFLLPTLAIFLHERTSRVVTYVLLVVCAFSFSMGRPLDNEQDEMYRWRGFSSWRGMSLWFVSVASLVLAAFIGLMTRQ